MPDDIYCGSCGQPLQPAAPGAIPPTPVGTEIKCPVCGHMNEPDALYCEVDGVTLKAAAPAPVAVSAGVGFLVMPDNSELSLSQAKRTVGRADLVKYVKQEQVAEIGRAHLTISQENEIYYLQDGGPDPSNPQVWKPSVNKTYLNGEMLQPGEKRQLKQSDVISVAGLVSLTFKTR